MNIARMLRDFLRNPFRDNEVRPRESRFHLEQYGRRIETDRSWTVYHVFSGIPARAGGEILTGLSRSAATAGMLALNLGKAVVRQDRLALAVPAGSASVARRD
ncbi:hypothetical protein ACLB6G_18755 [Zhengella sp. ZM62]|uniref:hypothetical protein n=1 Tax=Zhengella sedimenti TaxID=3390035 RepID=UPI003976842C